MLFLLYLHSIQLEIPKTRLIYALLVYLSIYLVNFCGNCLCSLSGDEILQTARSKAETRFWEKQREEKLKVEPTMSPSTKFNYSRKNLLEIFRTTLEIACIINFAVIISFRLPLSLACLWWMWWTKNLSYCTTSEAKTIILNNIFKGGKQSKIKKFSSVPFLQPALWREQLSSILDYFNFTTSQNVFAPQGEGERREFMNSFIEKSVLLFVMIN